MARRAAFPHMCDFMEEEEYEQAAESEPEVVQLLVVPTSRIRRRAGASA